MKKILFTLALTFIGLHAISAQVGIGTETLHESSQLELQSKTKGFLPPRMTEDERNNISSPAQGLMIYCINCGTNGEAQVYNGTEWTNMTGGAAAGFVCGTSTVTFTYNGESVTYGTVLREYGGEVGSKCWLDRNLGASQVATTLDDADAYGDLYQWGRAADGHEDRNSTEYTVVETGSVGVANFDNDSANAWDGEFILRDSDANNWVDPSVSGVDNLWQGVNSANNPCPSGYRVPSEAELNAERLSWSSNNAAGAYASPLKLPVAGSRKRLNGGFFYVDFFGRYWSSTVSGAGARRLGFKGSGASMASRNRANGLSVRCLKD